MMNTIYKKMRTAVLGVLLCAFLSGCGKKEELVLISETETGAEAVTERTVEDMSEHTAEGMPEGTPENMGESTLSGRNSAEEDSDNAAAEPVHVYVCGAVVSPGVVELLPGSRADDALEAAGGFLEGARKDYVNLAARVEDGQMLYFPTEEEAKDLSLMEKILRKEETEESGLVNLNTADAEKLCTLPGIGEARASDIIAFREKNGPFKKPEEIMKVPGIKENAYEKLKDKITTQ